MLTASTPGEQGQPTEPNKVKYPVSISWLAGCADAGASIQQLWDSWRQGAPRAALTEGLAVQPHPGQASYLQQRAAAGPFVL